MLIPGLVFIVYKLFETEEELNLALMESVFNWGIPAYLISVIVVYVLAIRFLLNKNKVVIEIVISIVAILATSYSLFHYLPAVIDHFT